jgi:hypothetical protein
MQKMHFIEAPNNFYLGARIDPGTHTVTPDDIVYYDSRDLTTHGVILGMTGSGKTGLGISILEEAVLDNIPCLIIDPKGDITNMLLAFPEIKAEHFLPWVNPDDALRSDHTLEEHADAVASRWSEGLEEWGITNERIQHFRRAARFSIYTPGSEAGLPISILQSFAAPREGWEGNEEMLRERISGIVTALLALIGMNARPVEDKEHILLSNIFEFNWRNRTDLSLEQLILQTQRPPFTKLGVMDVESIFPEKERFKLAQTLNNIIASPKFQTWITGEPLNIPSFLYTPEGYPRTTIFYIAHLNDAERQFTITLLLETVLAWMRSLSGSTSLRALLYIDEVFGMFPPHPHNPPTKEPIMRLLKQARAFGVGVLVSTQNPKDIDYKGLSNAGTWFIGKLQTDNDRERVLEGLDSARDATSALDLRTVDALLRRIGPREFIMHNVHEPNTPIFMQTRWAMSYLRGPLTRQQISQLMANQRNLQQAEPRPYQSGPSHQPASQGQMPQQPAGFAQPAYQPAQPQPAAPPPKAAVVDEPPPGFNKLPPALPSSIYQYYLPVDYAVEQAVFSWEQWTRQPAVQVETSRRLLYRPCLLAQTMARFTVRPSNTTETYTYAFVVPTLPRVPVLDWGQYVSNPFDPYSLDHQPFTEAFYADLPTSLSNAAGFKDLQVNLVDWIYYNAALFVYYNPVLKMYSGLDEDRQSFLGRVQAVAREQRDAEIDQVAARYDAKLATLEARADKKSSRLDNERQELDARKREEMITGAESLMQLMKGRAYYTLSRTSRMRRYTNTSEDQMRAQERDLMLIADQLEATEQEMQRTMQAVHDKWVNAVQQIEEVKISPYKKDIDVVLFGVGWVPYWDTTINGTLVILPASSSSLTYAQDPGLYGGGGY